MSISVTDSLRLKSKAVVLYGLFEVDIPSVSASIPPTNSSHGWRPRDRIGREPLPHTAQLRPSISGEIFERGIFSTARRYSGHCITRLWPVGGIIKAEDNTTFRTSKTDKPFRIFGGVYCYPAGAVPLGISMMRDQKSE